MPAITEEQINENGNSILNTKVCKTIGKSKKGFEYELGIGLYVFKFPAPKKIFHRGGVSGARLWLNFEYNGCSKSLSFTRQCVVKATFNG